jgi:hypothetical protein
MTSNEVDYYDVERMIEDATQPLRSELAQLRAELEAEREHRRESVDAIGRVVSSRTDHLA